MRSPDRVPHLAQFDQLLLVVEIHQLPLHLNMLILQALHNGLRALHGLFGILQGHRAVVLRCLEHDGLGLHLLQGAADLVGRFALQDSVALLCAVFRTGARLCLSARLSQPLGCAVALPLERRQDLPHLALARVAHQRGARPLAAAGRLGPPRRRRCRGAVG